MRLRSLTHTQAHAMKNSNSHIAPDHPGAPDWMKSARPRHDEDGREILALATCGTCGRTWNDALISGRTPAPSGRCPFEDEHADDPAPVHAPAHKQANGAADTGKVELLEIVARALVGDGQAPDVFIVSAGERGVVMISRHFDPAYELWQSLPYADEATLENRTCGVICSVEAEGAGSYMVVDDADEWEDGGWQ